MKTAAMKRCRLALVLAAALVACGEPPGPGEPTGDPELLAGRWEFTLRRGVWARLLPVGGEAVRGRVWLRPFAGDSFPADRGGGMVPCTGCLRGTVRLEKNGWLPQPPRGDSAAAVVFTDGSAMIFLQVAGNCHDCGNLMLTGRIQGERVSGDWQQEVLGRGLSGTFVLRYLPGARDVHAAPGPATRARPAP
ncbi:MAG: hypothetical protein ACJ8GN_15115 [Longimicrobiaceae bacterium]